MSEKELSALQFGARATQLQITSIQANILRLQTEVKYANDVLQQRQALALKSRVYSQILNVKSKNDIVERVLGQIANELTGYNQAMKVKDI